MAAGTIDMGLHNEEWVQKYKREDENGACRQCCVDKRRAGRTARP